MEVYISLVASNRVVESKKVYTGTPESTADWVARFAGTDQTVTVVDPSGEELLLTQEGFLDMKAGKPAKAIGLYKHGEHYNLFLCDCESCRATFETMSEL